MSVMKFLVIAAVSCATTSVTVESTTKVSATAADNSKIELELVARYNLLIKASPDASLEKPAKADEYNAALEKAKKNGKEALSSDEADLVKGVCDCASTMIVDAKSSEAAEVADDDQKKINGAYAEFLKKPEHDDFEKELIAKVDSDEDSIKLRAHEIAAAFLRTAEPKEGDAELLKVAEELSAKKDLTDNEKLLLEKLYLARAHALVELKEKPELSPNEKAAFEAYEALVKADTVPQALKDAIASLEATAAEINSDDMTVSRAAELVFKNRRDDAIYNLYIDSADKESEESKALLEKALTGYTPKLWESYTDEANFVELKEEATEGKVFKNYINIPVSLELAKTLDVASLEKGAKSSDLKFADRTDVSTVDAENEKIRSVMKRIRENTCINFTEIKDASKLKEKKQQYVEFSYDNERGCDEIVGQKGTDYEFPQRQPMNEKCLKKESFIGHYFMHTLGFDNEHQRPDVEALGNMIVDMKDGKLNAAHVAPGVPLRNKRDGMNDLKEETDSASALTGKYDIKSIMHWSNHFIQDKSDSNIVHMRQGLDTLFSEDDIKKINSLYGCEEQGIAQQDSEEIDCNLIINEDTENKGISDACLKTKVGENKFAGEANIAVLAHDSKMATITLDFELEAETEEAEEETIEQPLVQEEAPKADEETAPVEEAEKVAEAEAPVADAKAPAETAEAAVTDDETAAEDSLISEDLVADVQGEEKRRLVVDYQGRVLQEETLQEIKITAEEEKPAEEEKRAAEEVITAAAEEAEPAAEAPVDAAPADASKEDAPAAEEAQEEPVAEEEAPKEEAPAADSAEETPAAADVATDAPVDAEAEVAADAEVAVEEAEVLSWKEEYLLKEESIDAGVCTSASLALNNGEADMQVLCGAQNAYEFHGACGKLTQMRYKLTTSTPKVEIPRLSISVKYDECVSEIALNDEDETQNNGVVGFSLATIFGLALL